HRQRQPQRAPVGRRLRGVVHADDGAPGRVALPGGAVQPDVLTGGAHPACMRGMLPRQRMRHGPRREGGDMATRKATAKKAAKKAAKKTAAGKRTAKKATKKTAAPKKTVKKA